MLMTSGDEEPPELEPEPEPAPEPTPGPEPGPVDGLGAAAEAAPQQEPQPEPEPEPELQPEPEEPAPVVEAEPMSLDEMRPFELKDILKEAGLSPSGSKAELIERIQAFRNGELTAIATEEPAAPAVTMDFRMAGSIEAEAGEEGSEERQAFTPQFVADLAKELGVPTERLEVETIFACG